MKRNLWFFFAFSQLLFWSCNNDDKKASETQAPSDLFLDYKVSAEEGAEYAVVLLHFREHGAEGNAVALEDGSQVTFDGEVLVADSARLTGVYYEAQRPLSEFAKNHVILYKDKSGKTYEQAFSFVPLALQNQPTIISRQPLTLPVGATAGKGKVQVLLTDTSYKTADINEEYTPNNGNIVITPDALRKVANGPLTLELIREEVQKLPNGRLSISYTLRRELELK